MKKSLEDLLKEQEDQALENSNVELEEDAVDTSEDGSDVVEEEVDSEEEMDDVEEAAYPTVDFKKSAAKGTAKGGKASYPTVDYKQSVAKGGPQKPGMMPKVDFKGEGETTNKKTPTDPETYPKVKPNFSPEVVAQLTKEDISDETKSHLDALFSGEELSEEFVARVKEIFESAVIVTAQKALNEKVDELKEQFDNQFETVLQVAEEEVETFKADLNEKSDSYLNYVVEQWIADNEPTIQSNIKTELTESFINGLQKLFVEHYIDIPEDKVDIVEEMTEEIERLKNEYEAVLHENLNLHEDNKNAVKKFLIKEQTKELSENEKEKFEALVEHISFDDEESFKEKMEEITEAYFGDSLIIESSLEDDTPLENLDEDVKTVPENNSEVANMAAYMSKFLKKQ